MDPVANIRRQRELAAEILGGVDDPTVPGYDADVATVPDYDAAVELAELVQALDEWRRSGGFDPYLTGVA